jgi:rhamnose transport system permease protein
MTTTVATPAATRFSRAGSLRRVRELGILVAILVVFGIATGINPGFAGASSVQQLLIGASLVALIGVGETMVIITRNYDLSVGSILGLSAYIVGMTFRAHPGTPVIVGFLIGIAVGAVVGVINGWVTTFFHVPSLVVTLAMLYIIRGVDGVVVGGKIIGSDVIPRSFQAVGFQNLFGVPWLAIIVAIVVAAGAYALRSFRWARDLYAIGSSPEAAGLAGIPTGRRVFTAFVVSGALAGLAGALFLALHAQIDVTGGTGYEFLVIAAAVVGGVAIFGGSGTVVGAALGAVLLNTINQALVATRVSAFWNQAIAGALLLAAIAFDQWLNSRMTTKLRQQEGAHREQ